MNLYDKLLKYSKEGVLPMHMPGHKRNAEEYGFSDPFAWDITEIDGFDNLHEPEDLLLQKLEQAREHYSSRQSWYLINGSTAGILAGISACVNPGDCILAARNCHKSVYNAMILNRINPVYLHPSMDPATGIMNSIQPEDVESALSKNKKIKLVFITSPTYEGVCSDVKKIASICHKHHVPFMVDEAHGAHFRVRKEEENPFPVSAGVLGADIVVQSLHKTLPSLTQTAILHCFGKTADPERIKFYLDIYQTSSPSYVLMASIDQCIEKISSLEWKKTLMNWYSSLQYFYEKTKDMKALKVWNPEGVTRDPSKFVITTEQTGHTGTELMEVLRNDYKIELEMASRNYVIAMTGAGDTQENILRFTEAILAIDERWMREKGDANVTDLLPMHEECILLNPADAFYRTKRKEYVREETVSADLIGKVSLDFLYVYPPGIPMIVPGEVITCDLLQRIDSYEEAGLHISGYRNREKKTIRIFSDTEYRKTV